MSPLGSTPQELSFLELQDANYGEERSFIIMETDNITALDQDTRTFNN